MGLGWGQEAVVFLEGVRELMAESAWTAALKTLPLGTGGLVQGQKQKMTEAFFCPKNRTHSLNQ